MALWLFGAVALPGGEVSTPRSELRIAVSCPAVDLGLAAVTAQWWLSWRSGFRCHDRSELLTAWVEQLTPGAGDRVLVVDAGRGGGIVSARDIRRLIDMRKLALRE